MNPNPPLLTVSQLTQAIKLSLESTFRHVYLQGEISNFKLQTSGHLYFSLKDEGAQIGAVMFRVDASLLKLIPKGGDKVIVKAEMNIYPSKGNYQLIVRELSYIGIGELLQKLEALKLKLHQKGWFKASRKKNLPVFPKCIGVVTSPTGAVIQDILNILSRRFSGFHLILNPVKVQGEGAAEEIAQAIEQFNQHRLVDVMIVGRGGGSLEDLWAFNEEIVAEAIFNSHIPIISAVGHETDHCIADYVADVRAPTPSAAAEIVISEKTKQLAFLTNVQKRMEQTLRHLIQKDRFRLNGLTKHPFLIRPQTMLEAPMQKLDDKRLDLELAIQHFLQLRKHQVEVKNKLSLALKPSNQINHYKQKLEYWRRTLTHHLNTRITREKAQLNQKVFHLKHSWTSRLFQKRHLFDKERLYKQLDQVISHQIKNHKEKLAHITDTFKVVNPRNLLNKGYSILFSENDRSVINSVQKLEKHQKAILTLSDGEAFITINEIIFREH